MKANAVPNRSLEEIEAEVDAHAKLIGAAGHRALPTYGRSDDFARPHVEVDLRGYHYVVVERGQELSRFTTHDLNELLYQVFDAVTSELAVDHEMEHRIETVDCRRLIFKHKVELLSQLSSEWAERAKVKQAEILRKHPFDDMSAARVQLTRELTEEGYPSEAAGKIAAERYPVPEVEELVQHQRDVAQDSGI